MNEETKKPGQKLGFFMSVALVMGNMIGSGVFLLPQGLAPFGWNAIAGWAVTIAGALCLAHVLAKLTASHEGAIGPAELVERSFGPLAGFLIGFAFWVSVWTGCVTIAVGATSYMSSFLPVLGEHPSLTALGVIWTMTAVNLLGVRSAGSFQVVTTLLKLTPLIVVAILIGMIFGREGMSSLAPYPVEGLSLPSVNTAAAMTLWAMIGFEAACAASHKIDNPQRNVPRATFYGALFSGIIYLIVCSGITLMLPAHKVAASPAPFELFVSTFWSPGPASFVAAFAAISAIGAVNGWTLVQAEVPLEMAKRQMMPQWFARTTANGVPINGLLSATVLGSLLVLANSSQSMAGLFTFMALVTTSVTLWLYLACAAVALKRKIAVPFAVLGLVFGIWSLWGAGVDASGLSIVLMLAGLPLYWWTRRSLPKNDLSASTS
ncbi:amino acid permease [uncultured Sphingorhabdus sp.]|uniref:amino acid permease n=1 Tax=uncultured Sphingorhabdus sp. TaxID=1686106 RepID=UPI002623A35F|nr:amino acid permease [uncultured Sphingorhabdus sp.]HMS20664.1 amino acid permease [Sphingorhabdus sp.]